MRADQEKLDVTVWLQSRWVYLLKLGRFSCPERLAAQLALEPLLNRDLSTAVSHSAVTLSDKQSNETTSSKNKESESAAPPTLHHTHLY